jgi:uncharacterized protein
MRNEIKIDQLVITSINSIKEINKHKWNDFVEFESPLFDFEFLESMEKSGCTSKEYGWEPNHIIISEGPDLLCIIPNFIKLNSNGEYVFDHSWAQAYYQMGLEYYPKLLSAIPFTPINGKRFFFKKKYELKEYVNCLKEFIIKKKESSFHFNFIEKNQSDSLIEQGFFQRLGIQYHWKNNGYSSFDDFLSNLKSKKKKNIVKERKSLKDLGICIHAKIGTNINKEDWRFFYNCYVETIKKKWSYQYLNFDFFLRLSKSNLINKILLIVAEDKNGKKIACSLNFIGNQKLSGRYWGCIDDVPFLHFELCYYQPIEFAIKNKIKIIEAGAQGEHKISRGYIPTITYSNHWIKDSEMSFAIESFLKKESEIVKKNVDYLLKSIPFKLNKE